MLFIKQQGLEQPQVFSPDPVLVITRFGKSRHVPPWRSQVQLTRGEVATFLDTVNSYWLFYSQFDSFLLYHMYNSPSFETLLKTKREMMVRTARMVDSAAATP